MIQSQLSGSEVMSKCYWCGVDPCIEPREVSGYLSCGVCREIDRLRGICTLIPAEHHQCVVSELRVLSGRLREWQANRFGGPPDNYVEPRVGPEPTFAQSLKPAEPKGPPPDHLRVDSQSHIEAGAEASSSKKKRKKKNKGRSRVDWQKARGAVVRSRLQPLGQSGSELTDTSSLE